MTNKSTVFTIALIAAATLAPNVVATENQRMQLSMQNRGENDKKILKSYKNDILLDAISEHHIEISEQSDHPQKMRELRDPMNNLITMVAYNVMDYFKSSLRNDVQQGSILFNQEMDDESQSTA